jgi:adenylate cyclase
VALRNGDVISIGGLELQFVQSGKLEESSERVSYPPETMFYRSIDEITVVVTDVRGYTRLCQEIGEARVAEIVHAFNSDAGTVLAGLNVWGVKHIGDAVMAIWVHRGSRTASLVAALRGISELLEIAETLQSRFGLASPVLLGAAVNTGVASIGNMGSIAAADYTALGDVVNKVFRLEAATRELQADVVISSEVCDALLPEMDLRNSTTAHRVQLKGYTEPTLVYVMSRSALHKELEDLGTRFVPAPPKSA